MFWRAALLFSYCLTINNYCMQIDQKRKKYTRRQREKENCLCARQLLYLIFIRRTEAFNDDPHQTSKKAAGFCLSFLLERYTDIFLFISALQAFIEKQMEMLNTFQFAYALEIHLKYCFNMFHLHVVLEMCKTNESERESENRKKCVCVFFHFLCPIKRKREIQ